MKAVWTSVVLAGLVWTGVAVGDYVSPPGWESNPYFTYQSWDFATDANPCSPVGDYVNPAGVGYATITGGQWVNQLPVGRQGGWQISGGTGAIEFTIPSVADPNLTQEVWFQMTLFTNDFALMDHADARVYADDGTIDYQWETITPIDLNQGLVQYTAVWTVTPQPASGRIVLSADFTNNPGLFVILDRADIATRSVPEPATIGLLLSGLAMAFRRRS